jgi:hypothetical protein
MPAKTIKKLNPSPQKSSKQDTKALLRKKLQSPIAIQFFNGLKASIKKLSEHDRK